MEGGALLVLCSAISGARVTVASGSCCSEVLLAPSQRRRPQYPPGTTSQAPTALLHFVAALRVTGRPPEGGGLIRPVDGVDRPLRDRQHEAAGRNAVTHQRSPSCRMAGQPGRARRHAKSQQPQGLWTLCATRRVVQMGRGQAKLVQGSCGRVVGDRPRAARARQRQVVHEPSTRTVTHVRSTARTGLGIRPVGAPLGPGFIGLPALYT